MTRWLLLTMAMTGILGVGRLLLATEVPAEVFPVALKVYYPFGCQDCIGAYIYLRDTVESRYGGWVDIVPRDTNELTNYIARVSYEAGSAHLEKASLVVVLGGSNVWGVSGENIAPMISVLDQIVSINTTQP